MADQDGYRVRDPADRRGHCRAPCRRCRRLAGTTATVLGAGPASSVLTTPYADPDVVALRRANRIDNLTFASTLAPRSPRPCSAATSPPMSPGRQAG